MNLLNIILPTFIVILIGFFFGRLRRVDMSAVVDIALYIGLPALIFTSMLKKSIVLDDAMKVWASALIIMIGCGVTAWIIFRALKKKHSGLYIPIVIMNTVNIPFPIIYLAFGAEGLYAATLFYIPNALLVFTLGVYIASKKHWKESVKEVFRVPLIYAAILGLLCNLLRIDVPEIIIRPLNFIGLMALPLTLITLGYNLSTIKITSLPTTLLASFLRMGVGILLGALMVHLFDLSGILRAIVILDSAMPAAVIASVLTTKYDNEAELVSSVVLVTTVISLITIPLLLIILS